jgi:hypothetical protein
MNGVNPEGPTLSGLAAASAPSQQAFLVFVCFIHFEYILRSILWRTLRIPQVFLLTQGFNINGFGPFLFSLSFLCLYLSLRLSVYIVDCKA